MERLSYHPEVTPLRPSKRPPLLTGPERQPDNTNQSARGAITFGEKLALIVTVGALVVTSFQAGVLTERDRHQSAATVSLMSAK